MRRHLSSTSIFSEGRDYYLYVVLCYSVGKYSHSLHRIGLSSLRYGHGKEELRNLPKPIYKFPFNSFPSFMGFLAVESRVYIFGGGENSRVKEKFSRDCYVLDTSNNPKIRDGPPMNFGKHSPMVMGPVNGKFYVLSYTLAARDLEEFNPQTESWNPLPPPPIACEELERRNYDYLIRSYAIVENKLYMATEQKGIYTFDVISHHWEHLSSLGGNNRFPFVERAVFLDGLWYSFPQLFAASPLHAYCFDGNNGFQKFCDSGVTNTSRFLKNETGNRVVPLGDRMLGIVRYGLREYNLVDFYVTVDMCEFAKFDIKSSREANRPEVCTQYSARYIKNDDLGEPLALYTCFVIECEKGHNRDRERDRDLNRLRDDMDYSHERKLERNREGREQDRQDRESGRWRSRSRSRSRRDHQDRDGGEHRRRHHQDHDGGEHRRRDHQDHDGGEHHKRHGLCSASPGRWGDGPENISTQGEPKKKKAEEEDETHHPNAVIAMVNQMRASFGMPPLMDMSG